MLRKDFKVFRIFKELFVFVIDSPVVYSQTRSCDSMVYSSPGSPDLVTQKPSGEKHTSESRPTVINSLGSLDLCSKFIKKSTLRCSHQRGCQDADESPPRSRYTSAYLPPGSQDSAVYLSLGSRFGHWGVIFQLLRNIQNL
jgi:hypothetical protein